MFGTDEKPINANEKPIVNPEYFEARRGLFYLNDTCGIASYISALPNSIMEGWLAIELLLRRNHFLDISIFIYPIDEKEMLNRLDAKISELESKIREYEEKGREDVEPLRKEKEILELFRDKLILRQSKLFRANFLFYILSKSEENVENCYDSFRRRLQGINLVVSRVRYKVLEAFKSLLPEFHDLLPTHEIVDSDFLSASFPFVKSGLIHESGILYGFEVFTGHPIIIDRFKLAGHNEVIIGKIGSGKSFFAKLETLRWYVLDPKIKLYLVDPLSGFKDLADLLNAQVVKVGEVKINPLDLFILNDKSVVSQINEKISDLMDFFSVFYSEIGEKLNKIEAGVLRRAIFNAYKKGKVTENFIGNVTINDVYNKLLEVTRNYEEKQAAKNLLSSFEAFKTDLNMFNGRTEINTNSRVIYFDFSGVRTGTTVRPVVMHAILSWISAIIRGSFERKIVTIDEAHYFLSSLNIRKFLEKCVRHSRHYKAGYTLITQGFNEFLSNKEGMTILNNTDIFLIFKQDAIPDRILKLLDISEDCEKLIKEAVQGKISRFSTALLVLPGKDTFYINITSSPAEAAALSVSGKGC